MRKRQLTAALMAGIITCGALAGCGGGSKTAESQGAAGDTNTTTAAGSGQAADSGQASGGAASGEKQVLSVTTWDNDASPQFQAVIDAYEGKNPNVEIKVIDTSADEYNNSLGISLSAAQPDPDVIWVKDMGSMLQMADKEQLMPIDDFIARDNFDMSI